MTLERKFIQQLCRNQTGFPRVQDCTCQSSIPDDDAFPYGMWSPTSRYDHQKQKAKKKKGIHRSFQHCIKNFCKKDKSVRDEEQQQQCTGSKKEIALACTPPGSHPAWSSLRKKPSRSKSPWPVHHVRHVVVFCVNNAAVEASLRESDFVPLHRNAVHFVVDLWRVVATCMHKSFSISLWTVGVHGGKVRGRDSHQCASCWMAGGASGQYFVLFFLMLLALQSCTVENATVCTHVSRIWLWEPVWKLELDVANCAASLCTTVYGFQIRRKVLQWHMMFRKCFFSLEENWLRICILCSLPCDLVAGIAVSSRTMLQFCGMGNHLWQNWPQGMHLHMRSATDRTYACIEGDSTFAPRRETDPDSLGSRFCVQLLVLTRLEDRI
jgi:hypothetical protein